LQTLIKWSMPHCQEYVFHQQQVRILFNAHRTVAQPLLSSFPSLPISFILLAV
jgi:hypothetical protein